MGVEPRVDAQPKFSGIAAPIEKPLPLWILYPLFFVAVYLSHWSLLRLPFFWDEAGYYIPAALDFFRDGSLVPHSTVTNAHPPLPSILLAGWWHLGGFVISGTRTFVAMVAAGALLGVFRLARLLAGDAVAAVVTLLTALYPIWFAQSTLAHADIFAAAFTLWGLSFYFERFAQAGNAPVRARTRVAVAILFSLAALSKETAIVTPAGLALWEVVLLVTERKEKRSGASAAWLVALASPVLPLALWYLYHWHKTGFVFGNPEFLRYNATANLSVMRIAVSLWHRVLHLGFHMNMYVPLLATLAVMFMPRLRERVTLVTTKPVAAAIAIVVASNAIAFSVLGGALLTRYLLPLYPLVLLVCVALWYERLRAWWSLGLLAAVGFLLGLVVNPPYAFAPEDNLTYRDMVVLHQQAVRVIATRFPAATVLTAWPAVAELQRPELGYTARAVKTVSIDNFSSDQIAKAAADPGAYDTALVFSTKWVPPAGRFNLGAGHEATDTRFFDFHRDLQPQEVARMLGGAIVWQGRRGGEWAAVLRFPRSMEAAMRPARGGRPGGG